MKKLKRSVKKFKCRDDGSSTKVESGTEGDGDYLQMLQTTLASEVDKFFNRDCGEDTTITIAAGDNHCPVSIAEEVISEVKNFDVKTFWHLFKWNIADQIL